MRAGFNRPSILPLIRPREPFSKVFQLESTFDFSTVLPVILLHSAVLQRLAHVAVEAGEAFVQSGLEHTVVGVFVGEEYPGRSFLTNGASEYRCDFGRVAFVAGNVGDGLRLGEWREQLLRGHFGDVIGVCEYKFFFGSAEVATGNARVFDEADLRVQIIEKIGGAEDFCLQTWNFRQFFFQITQCVDRSRAPYAGARLCCSGVRRA